jgi:hypothetical protein
MANRGTLLLDRLATILIALALIAAGVLGIWWWSDRSPLPGTIDVAAARELTETAWWPWITAIAGVFLVLLGLRWILAHLNRRKVSRLHLHGSGPGGRLDASGSKVVGAAADALSDTLGVRSARGVVVRDRGQLVARLSAVVEPECDLRAVAERADTVSVQLAQVLGRDDVRCSVQLRVAPRGGRLPRVT